VFENLELALAGSRSFLKTLRARITAAQQKRIDEVLDIIGLSGQRGALGRSLAHGQKQWLEIGMLLMQNPELSAQFLAKVPMNRWGKPEEIGKLLAAMDAGADYVGGVRRNREDAWWRRTASKMMNGLRERITRIRMTDQGCMLRAYGRDIVDAVAAAREVSTFIPALAYTFAHRPVEVDVLHEERAAGESKYSMYRLIRLNEMIMTLTAGLLLAGAANQSGRSVPFQASRRTSSKRPFTLKLSWSRMKTPPGPPPSGAPRALT